ncbi:Chorismate synthase [Forsythia ovata]|uniref:chorismate synthase n=1 Tax=Forsythia ovata TaxID=205694 RepID=A0ABD1WZD9_9LAMI
MWREFQIVSDLGDFGVSRGFVLGFLFDCCWSTLGSGSRVFFARINTLICTPINPNPELFVALAQAVAGLGSPVFDKLEAELAKPVMSIPATNEFEVGSGFAGIFMTGSENNDEFYMDEHGNIRTKTNRSGGICKLAIKMTNTRIEIIRKKRNAMKNYLRNDIVHLLKNGLDINAYGRVRDFIHAALNAPKDGNFSHG